MQLRNLSALLGTLYRYLKSLCIIVNFLLHHHYNCRSHRYDNQLQLGLRSYRTERIVIISVGTDRNILLFVVNNLLCFTGDELRYIRLILNGGT